MHEEYGDLDCDYVFVNLWGGRRGAPMRYDSVYELARRTSAKLGFDFTPHTLRHTHATLARRGGMSLDALRRMLTHRSQSSTTIYAHLDVEDLRMELERAGMLGGGAADLMRALAVAPSPGERSSWERLLVEMVKTEFRVEVFIARKGSPLLGAGCVVAGCTGYGYHRP